jgi:hypothetical protein
MAATAITADNRSRIVMLAFGNMQHGNSMYWAYLAVKPTRYEEFRRIMAGKKYNIQNFVKDEFGEVVVSGEGGLPPRDVTKKVAQLFGIPINELFADINPIPVIEQAIEKLKKNSESE